MNVEICSSSSFSNTHGKRSHTFHMERFNLKKLNEVEGKEQVLFAKYN
jgi:hypothetical protein